MEFIPPPTKLPLLAHNTLPPRLIIWEDSNLFSYAYEHAVWLTNEWETVIVPEVLNVKMTSEGCQVIPKTEGLLINGQALKPHQILKDGDLIHDQKKLRVIFDGDPVGIYRRVALDDGDPDLLETFLGDLKITGRMEQFIRIKTEGISLDGGETFYTWEQIACIGFEAGRLPYFSHRICVYLPDALGGMNLGAERSITRTECASLIRWLEDGVPLFLPFRCSLWRLDKPISAYYWLVQELHIARGEAPFLSESKIMPQSGERLRSLIFWFGVIEVFGALMGLGVTGDHPDRPPVEPLRGVIAGMISAPLTLLFLSVLFFGSIWLWRQLRKIAL